MPDNPSIDNAFITQFEDEVKLEYQRAGSKLSNMVRRSNTVVGSTVKFQKMGAGTAGEKARHGDVPVMNLDHSVVSANITDHYAAEYVDDLDMFKLNIDEQGAVKTSIAAAMGRKTDVKIDAAMQASSVTDTTAAALTKARVQSAQELFNTNDIPADGQRFWAVGPQQWTNLLNLTEFSTSDYIGFDEMPFKGGMVAKRWLDWFFFMFTGITKVGAVRRTFAWHKIAVGLGVGKELALKVNFVPQKESTLFSGSESNGAVIIDNEGVIRVDCTES